MSGPLRGRNPSKANRLVGRPLTTRAAIIADGPGTTSTVWPAAAAAATRRSPGSEMPGMPASVTTTTVSPLSSRASTLRHLGRLVVVVHGEEPAPRRQPEV